MVQFSRFIVAACVAVGAGMLTHPGHAQNPPAVTFESMMNSFFGDKNGLVSFTEYDVAFPPKGKVVKGLAGILGPDGKVLAKFPILPDYRVRKGVFGRIQVQGPADVRLTKPGNYTMVFAMGGKAISRLSFKLIQTGAGTDPFNPVKTYAFDGLWRRLGYIVAAGTKAEPIPEFWIWLGQLDKADAKKFQEYFMAHLMRGGKVIAHSKRTQGNFGHKHFQRTRFSLYHPHTKRQTPNAIFYSMKDLLRDGKYQLRITRRDDKKLLRDFQIVVAKGKLLTIKRTELGYKPATDLIVPRVVKSGTTGYEFHAATWIVSK